jgi:hypothetical protein
MNERIEKLSIEANDQTGNEFDLNHKPLDAFLEKFAELIVRECIQSIKNTIQTVCDTDSEKMGCEFAITDLIQHFGVE